MQSGLDILMAVRGRIHPLADLIIDMAASHVHEWGDGVKRILLMLQLFLRAIRKQQNFVRGGGGTPSTSLAASEAKWRCDLIAQVARFRRHILPGLLLRLRRRGQSLPLLPSRMPRQQPRTEDEVEAPKR